MSEEVKEDQEVEQEEVVVPDPALTLQLNLTEVNAILTILGEKPYSQVADLILKIRAQGIQQLQEEAQAAE